MAKQPPVRPWFRLASLRSVSTVPPPPPAPSQEPRLPLVQPTVGSNSSPSPSPSPPPQPANAPPPPPPPAPSQEPRLPLVQPTVRSNSSPSPSPPPQPANAPPPPQSAPADRGSAPSSPVQKPLQSSSPLPASYLQRTSPTVTQSSSPTKKPDQPPSSSSSSPDKAVNGTMARRSSPSPKPLVQTPVQSQKVKPTTPPPSPLTLPPSQLRANSETETKIPVEAESKNVILQKTIENPKQWYNRNSGEIRKTHSEKEKGNHRGLSESEDSAMRMITIAGENRGAYMELIRSPNKHEFGDKPNYLYKKGNSKTKSDGSESENSSSDARNGNKSNRGRTKSSYPMAAFMNSNVQCVNNSLLYNASCTHHDPGVRLSLTKKPFEGGGFHVREVVNGKHD